MDVGLWNKYLLSVVCDYLKKIGRKPNHYLVE